MTALLLLFPLTLLMIACNNNDIENEPAISFLRSYETPENEETSPVYYMLDVEAESIGILNQFGEEFTYYDLEYFTQDDNVIEFTYEMAGVTLEKQDEFSYIDENGNRYQMIELETD